jgi:hypothetical protein
MTVWLSVSLPARLHGTTRLPLDGYPWNLIFEYCSITYQESQVSINLTRITGILFVYLCRFMIISRSVILKIRNVSYKVCEKFKLHILCSVTFLRKSCRLWHNVEKYGIARQDTDGTIIRCTRIGCWIPKATYTHSEHVIIITFPRKLVTRRGLEVRLYLNCLSCWNFLVIGLAVKRRRNFMQLIAFPSWGFSVHFLSCKANSRV